MVPSTNSTTSEYLGVSACRLLQVLLRCSLKSTCRIRAFDQQFYYRRIYEDTHERLSKIWRCWYVSIKGRRTVTSFPCFLHPHQAVTTFFVRTYDTYHQATFPRLLPQPVWHNAPIFFATRVVSQTTSYWLPFNYIWLSWLKWYSKPIS